MTNSLADRAGPGFLSPTLLKLCLVGKVPLAYVAGKVSFSLPLHSNRALGPLPALEFT